MKLYFPSIPLSQLWGGGHCSFLSNSSRERNGLFISQLQIIVSKANHVTDIGEEQSCVEKVSCKFAERRLLNLNHRICTVGPTGFRGLTFNAALLSYLNVHVTSYQSYQYQIIELR